ncbi:MAG TPA: DUF6516 family protein [Pirellulales bacterium]
MASRPAKHNPCLLATYLNVHNNVMEQCRRSGFVGADTLQLSRYGRDFLLEGEIGCQGRIVIGARKILECVSVPGRPIEVQTLVYAYNVSVRGHNKIFRYDNQHASWRYPGHRDEHHKHLFDWRTGDELAESPLWMGVDGWPTLHEVVDEARDWHAANRAALDAPDDFPPNLQSVLRT